MSNIVNKGRKPVRTWLIIGAIMVLIQVLIGGVTRLTGSGLSITQWEIITGTLPPLNENSWYLEFDEYKATTQYKIINGGMTLNEFKFIYFWEYFHRLWARIMGFVFIIPFFFFWFKKYFTKTLFKDLLIILSLAALTASFGWIMVMSGLGEKPWVSPYKLMLHLILAGSVLLYTVHTALKVHFNTRLSVIPRQNSLALVFFLLIFQIAIGALLSGSHGALFYPTWPSMNGSILPEAIFNSSAYSTEAFVHYDEFPILSALVQTVHRFNAYFIYLIALVIFIRRIKSKNLTAGWITVFIILNFQVLLGILTLINSKGAIPVDLASLHQVVGFILLIALYVHSKYSEVKGLGT